MKKIFISSILWLVILSVQSQTVEQITGYYQFKAVTLSDITAFNNKLYFFGSAEQNVYGLLSSTGTSFSTTLIKQFDALTNLKVVGNHLIFFNSGNQLWQSDGTEAGTTLLKTISKSGDFRYAILNEKAYFGGDASNSNPVNDQLWVTDGTPNGTKQVKVINPSGPAYIRDVYAAGGKIYFSAYDGGGNGYYMQPWVSDGTAEGTFKLKTVKSTLFNDAMPRNFTAMNGKVYFSMYDDASACQLWVTDGTPESTKKFTDSISTSNGLGLYPSSLIAFNSKLYFAGSDLKNQVHLWVTDGVESNTKVLKANISPSSMVIFNNKMYLSAWDSTYKYELWSSDGTAEGTNRVTKYPGLSPSNILPFQDRLIMLGTDTTTGATEVFISDGTDAGTICPVPPTTSADVFTFFQGWVPLNNSVYFRAAFGHFTDYEICRLIKTNSSGLHTDVTDINVSVNPNPTTGLFRLTLPESWQTAQVEIYNTANVLCLKQTITTNTPMVDLSDLPRGLYIVKISGGNRITFSKKIIKM